MSVRMGLLTIVPSYAPGMSQIRMVKQLIIVIAMKGMHSSMDNVKVRFKININSEKSMHQMVNLFTLQKKTSA